MASRPFSFAAASVSWTHRVFLFIAVAIGARVYLYSRPCVNDPVVSIEVMPSGERIEIYPCQVFSESYQEARSLFRREVQSLGLTFDSLVVVEDLTIDIVVVPGSQSGLVFHSSGVHGVEGFAGSAVQVAFLQELKKKQQNLGENAWKPLPGMPTVILVHAFNPFGMARYRRFNENNVDLNRNALDDEELKILAASHSNHENYQKFYSLLNPGKAPSWLDSYFVFWMKAVYYIWMEGYFTLKAALVGGQYYQKNGIFYGGGHSMEKSTQLVGSWLENYLGNATLENNDAPIVTWIDVHTGLGPMGVDTLLQGANSVASPNGDSSAEIAKWFSKQGSGTTQKSFQTDVSKGYEKSRGFVEEYYAKKFFLDHRYQAFMICQEFGTVPGVMVAHALLHENAAFGSTDLSLEDKLAWAKRTTGRAFYPQNPDWRKAVLNRGIQLLYQAMARSSQQRVQQQQQSAT